MNSGRVTTVIRRLRRRPVSARAAEMAIALIKELARAQALPRHQVPREDTDGGDELVAEDEDIVVNADRLADPSKRR